MNWNTLRNKVLAVVLLPTVLLIMLIGTLVYLGGRRALEEELGQRLSLIGQTLSTEFSGGVEAAQIARLDATKARTMQRLEARLESVREATGVRRVFLMDPEFRSLVDTDEEVAFHQRLFAVDADRFEVERALETRTPSSSVLFKGEDGTLYKTSYVPVLLKGEPEEGVPAGSGGQPVALVGVMASASFFDVLNGLTSSVALLGGLSLLLMIALATLFARGLTRPLSRLLEATQRLERGDFQEPVLSPDEMASRNGRGDEIDRLAISFEEMRRAVLDRDRQMQMMLSGIAHEVRNPLGGMELFCGLLREDLEMDEPPDEDRLRKVLRIERELTYLNRVVTNFLDFARQRQLERERFGVLELMNEISLLLCAEVEGCGCDVRVDVSPEDLEVTADREKLRRALINMVRNAWQASPEGGEIVLSGRRLEGAAQGALFTELCVQDHGEGIAPDKIEEILTPFFTTREKGSGLGLAMSKKILEQHGGQLLIESVPGEGTTMRCLLPFDPSLTASAMEQEGGVVPEGWLG